MTWFLFPKYDQEHRGKDSPIKKKNIGVMTSKLNWDKEKRRRQMDDYFRSTDNRVRFGHSLIEKQEKEAQEWLIKHPDHNIKQVKNEKMLKLASRLYKRLQVDPDFKSINKSELWEIALNEAKRNTK